MPLSAASASNRLTRSSTVSIKPSTVRIISLRIARASSLPEVRSPVHGTRARRVGDPRVAGGQQQRVVQGLNIRTCQDSIDASRKEFVRVAVELSELATQRRWQAVGGRRRLNLCLCPAQALLQVEQIELDLIE